MGPKMVSDVGEEITPKELSLRRRYWARVIGGSMSLAEFMAAEGVVAEQVLEWQAGDWHSDCPVLPIPEVNFGVHGGGETSEMLEQLKIAGRAGDVMAMTKFIEWTDKLNSRDVLFLTGDLATLSDLELAERCRILTEELLNGE